MHLQFFQVNSMKLLPLIGSLLISATPVQAFETYEEFDKACTATEENTTLCADVGQYVAANTMVMLLCILEGKGRITKENLDLSWDEWNKLWNRNNGNPMWNAGAEKVLENLPECSIKP